MEHLYLALFLVLIGAAVVMASLGLYALIQASDIEQRK